MREAEECFQLLDAGWARWHGRLSPRIMNLLRWENLTIEEAALLSDADLLKLPRFGARSLREFSPGDQALSAARVLITRPPSHPVGQQDCHERGGQPDYDPGPGHTPRSSLIRAPLQSKCANKGNVGNVMAVALSPEKIGGKPAQGQASDLPGNLAPNWARSLDHLRFGGLEGVYLGSPGRGSSRLGSRGGFAG